MSSHADDRPEDASHGPMLLPLQLSYKPHGRYGSTYGSKIVNLEEIRLFCNDVPKDGLMFRGVLGDQHITYLAVEMERWQDFLTELYFYSHPRLLRPLQGSCVSSLIGVHQSSCGHFVLAVEPPDHRGWFTAEARRLSEQQKQSIIDAYAIIHAHGTLHGSVSLQNILIDNDGRVKIIDFTQASQKAGRMDEQFRFLGVRGFQPCDRAFEIRHVKFLLDYEGAREKEWGCTRRAVTVKAYSSDLKSNEPFFIPKDTLHAWEAHVEECSERGARRFKIADLDSVAQLTDHDTSAPAYHRTESFAEAEHIYVRHMLRTLSSLASQLCPRFPAPSISPVPSLPDSPSSGNWPITWLLKHTPQKDDSFTRRSAALPTALGATIIPPSLLHPQSPSPTEDCASGSSPAVAIPIHGLHKRRRDQEDDEDVLRHVPRRVRPKRPGTGTACPSTASQFIASSPSTSSGLYNTDISRPFPLAACGSPPLAYAACSDPSDSDALSSPSVKTPPVDAIADTAVIASPYDSDEEHSDVASNFSVCGSSDGGGDLQDDREYGERNDGDADDEDEDGDEDSLPELTFDITRYPSEDASSTTDSPASCLKQSEECDSQPSRLQPSSVILVDRAFVGTAYRVSEDMFRRVSEFVKNNLLSAVLPTRPTVLREGVPRGKGSVPGGPKRKCRDEEEMVLAKRVRRA